LHCFSSLLFVSNKFGKDFSDTSKELMRRGKGLSCFVLLFETLHDYSLRLRRPAPKQIYNQKEKGAPSALWQTAVIQSTSVLLGSIKMIK
jgi:hypothetical protein